MKFQSLNNPPNNEELNRYVKKRVDDRLYFWQPFITGLSVLNEDTIRNSTQLELLIIQEVLKRRENFLTNRVSKVELVERK